ncbi:MAG TPA: hypothetical protein VFW40_05920 [Capsulimonadaceae bacterium]|nr:hypothetical protein [Capsulimonadaceae bacterium]
MKRYSESDIWDEPFYLAGECAPPGLYQEVATGRTISLDGEDSLPASLDGHVACYRRISCTWRQIKGGSAGDKSQTSVSRGYRSG